MFTFTPSSPADKPTLYAELVTAARALVDGECDAVANMANLSALIWQFLPDLNWAGFYRLVESGAGDEELVLGPFQGKAACIRIKLGQGVCGTAAATRETQLVPDVHAFPGHIACDGDTASEIVLPVVHDNRLIAVLDLDSPLPARFDEEDAAGLQLLVEAIAPAIAR